MAINFGSLYNTGGVRKAQLSAGGASFPWAKAQPAGNTGGMQWQTAPAQPMGLTQLGCWLERLFAVVDWSAPFSTLRHICLCIGRSVEAHQHKIRDSSAERA